ncbi:hypothetical protein VB005_06756 [Metarhizium brunneum]
MQVTTFLVTVFAGLCLATPVAQDPSSTSIFGLNDNCHPFSCRRLRGCVLVDEEKQCFYCNPDPGCQLKTN